MGTVRVVGACLVGAGAELVTVEARFDRRDRERTEVVLTGLPDPVIRESRGKLESALEATGLHLPRGRLFLNLVPAARRKSGEILDLPLVLGAGAACGHLDPGPLGSTLFLGEVGIDGALHAVPGGLAAALAAAGEGLGQVVAPPATAREAAWIPGVRALGGATLGEVIAHLWGDADAAPWIELPAEEAAAGAARSGASLDDVRGQETGKMALAVAAAGGHGLLFVGPPGAGKSMLARRLPGLLAPPDLDERLEITRVLSAIGRWPGGLARERPFRAPHHTVSHAGLVGGGSPPTAGEITLAHRGVLFLDELPEFRREALEALRQPLESGCISIARAGHRVELPARFQLVAAMNPCPCGYRGHPTVPCRCPAGSVHRYVRRVSGPLLDRIDLRVELSTPDVAELTLDRRRPAAPPRPPHGTWVARVEAARRRRRNRQGERRNAELTAEELDRWAPLEGPAVELFARAARGRALSARAIQSVRRVARTVADLAEGSGRGPRRLGADHVARALGLRSVLGDLG